MVDIGTPLRSRKQLTTVVDVLNQSITLMTRRNSEEQLKALHAGDVLIQPPLAAYGVTDFGRAKDMIDAGYRATRALDTRLARLRPTGSVDAELTAARTPGQRNPTITAIKVENDSKVGDDVIRYYIRQPIGEPLNLARLQSDMGTLYGLDYFEQVQYRVVKKARTTPWSSARAANAAAPTTCAWGSTCPMTCAATAPSTSAPATASTASTASAPNG